MDMDFYFFVSFSDVMNTFDTLFLFITFHDLGKNTNHVKPSVV